MEETMTKDELAAMLIHSYDSLWRIKKDMPEGVNNPTLDREMLVLEVQLNALGVPTDTLK